MTPDATADVKKPEKPLDVALVGDKTEDGVGRKVLRLRAGSATLGELRPVEHGKPLSPNGEIVKLTPRDGAPPNVCDVETQFKLGDDDGASSGPAKVATDAYRDGWDRIFSAAPKGELN